MTNILYDKQCQYNQSKKKRRGFLPASMTLVRLLLLRRFRLRLRRLRRGGSFGRLICADPLTHEEQHNVCHTTILGIGNGFELRLLVGGDADAHNFVSDFFHRLVSFRFCFGVIASASLAKLAGMHDDAMLFFTRHEIFLRVLYQVFQTGVRGRV